MKLNRNKITVSRSAKDDTVEAVGITKSEALSFVWELTEEVYSLSGRYDVESRLQRDVISITRERS